MIWVWHPILRGWCWVYELGFHTVWPCGAVSTRGTTVFIRFVGVVDV